jgi:hypothetical protein
MESAERLWKTNLNAFNVLPLVLSFASSGVQDTDWAKEALQHKLKDCMVEEKVVFNRARALWASVQSFGLANEVT